MNNKKILVTVSEEMYDQVEEVQKKLGHMSISETGRYAFQALTKKELNNYVEIQKKRLKYRKENPVKISKKTKVADMRQNICDALEGKVEEGNNGLICTYVLYEELPGKKIEQTEQKVPFESLQEDIVEHQYKTLTGIMGTEARDKIKGILRGE